MPMVRGSVITPVRAGAAAVSGLTRHTLSSRLPDRPGKFRGTVRTDDAHRHRVSDVSDFRKICLHSRENSFTIYHGFALFKSLLGEREKK